MDSILYSFSDGVGRIVLNRPERGNAFNREMLSKLRSILKKVTEDEGLHVLVITGAGKHFCAGGDLEWMRAMGRAPYEENYRDALALYDTYEALENIPVPVISLVKGAVRGGGMGIVAASDLVIATEGSTFAFSEVRLGIVPSVVSSFALRRIGYAAARRLFLTGEVFGVDLAQHIGLVDVIVPLEELEKEGEIWVSKFLQNGPLALRRTKELLKMYRTFHDTKIRYITAHLLAITRAGDEAQEGIEAFLNKRKPRWVKS
ncbi:MAG: hypothetical protein GXO39_00790 [Thermotogae bacterium]|nr:hypothetical protein [Thermotogota bacterium]